jgi:hypothetical protein
MSRTLIISDLHLRHRQADTILSWEKYDRVVWLGDQFDQYSDTVGQNMDAAYWLKEKLWDDRNVFTLGNHDTGYRFPDNQWAKACSGYTSAKGLAIRKILTSEDWDRVKLYHSEQGILFTHAGIDRYWLDWSGNGAYHGPIGLSLEDITAWLDRAWPIVKAAYNCGTIHPLLEAGLDRGGYQKVGGITWLDLSNIKPIPGIAQIVGHTVIDPRKGPLFRCVLFRWWFFEIFSMAVYI